mmetsp:Transcript_16478/g.32166  ORF Transcript_16478/g.32166 Transcript_16478/m.32166 type:complete len:248 (+) Transcript_16478:129-872(+)
MISILLVGSRNFCRNLRSYTLHFGTSSSSELQNLSLNTSRSKSTLPGGFSEEGLRQWCLLTDFGSDGYQNLTSRDLRRRRREIDEIMEDPKRLPYTDLFDKKVSKVCHDYLVAHPSPTDLLGKAFFGSRNFIAERILLTMIDPWGHTQLPEVFNLGDKYLHWQVTMRAPLELICTWKLEQFSVKGCTMMAYDPSLKKVYHGNCFNVPHGQVDEGQLIKMGMQLHVKYAEFLVNGMIDELESVATTPT